MTVRLIEIPQDLPGFNRFISSWACTGSLNFLVDVGPAGSAGRLIESLEALGIDRIDYILITHIHIDHSGGLSQIISRYPAAKVVCHEKAVPLLVDPSKLWAGSLSVLGKTAEMYGEPKPVLKERLIPHTEYSRDDLHIVETPGHAAHHLSFSLDGRLFVGEAAGNYMKINNEAYVRPATPHRFYMASYLESLKRLLALEDQTICYGHFGEAQHSHEMLERFRDQLFRWKDIVLSVLEKEAKNPVSACMDILLEKDPELKHFHNMPPEVQARERFFLSNSIKGFIGLLKNHF